jgi:transducin (beta)-like 1
VSTLQKGLVYLSLEREFHQSEGPAQVCAKAVSRCFGDETSGRHLSHPKPRRQGHTDGFSQLSRDGPATAEAPPLGVFGPLITQPVPHQQRDDREPEQPDELEVSRKRQLERQQLPNGSPAKKPRLSNGYENGSETATVPMEIDHPAAEHNNHAYPSPLEGEPAPTPTPRTDGPETGTQVDKVEELATDTIFLRLIPEASPSAAETSPSQPNSTAGDHPIVLHCEWNPRDPSLLAAAGTDALARVWTVSRATAPEPALPDHVHGVSRPFDDLVEDDLPRTSTVTALAWNMDGTAIAVATESGSKARITVWHPDGTTMYRFDVKEPPVYKLRWNPNNASILGIAPDNGGALVTVFSGMTNTMSHFLPNHQLQVDPLDAAWISDTEFLLCGGDLLMSLRCTEDGIVQGREFETRKEDSFIQVQFDWRSKLVATATDKGIIDVSFP